MKIFILRFWMFRNIQNTWFNKLLAAIVILIGIPSIVKAESVNIDGLYYEISTDNGTATVTYESTTTSNYSSLTPNVIIPSVIQHDGNQYTVSAIGNRAFYNCKKIESIRIPSTVTQIGTVTTASSNRPFYNCTSLRSVWIEDSEESLFLGSTYSSSSNGTSLFYGCPLEELHIGRNIEYLDYNTADNYNKKHYRYGYSAC